MIETCCPATYEAAVADMNDDPVWARALLCALGAAALLGGNLRRVTDDGSGRLLLDWKLELRAVTFSVAAAFVHRHHAHCEAPVGWRFGAAVWNGLTLIGVVMVGWPVARGFRDKGKVEVNRLCVRRDVPTPLRWNACSKLYGWAAAEAERRAYTSIITYTRADEDGASLRAAGWVKEASVRGRSWSGPNRVRTERAAPIDKDRWVRMLHPRVPPTRRSPSPTKLIPMHLGEEV